MKANRGSKSSYRLALRFLIVVLAISLIPVLVLGRYDVQSGDDYAYGAETHQEYLRSGSIPRVLQAGWRQTVSSYYNWQGTYSAIFLMTLQPAVFAFHLYGITPILMLASLLAGFFSLCIVLFSDVFKTGKDLGGCVAAVVALLCVQTMPAPTDGLYWYNGSVYYTFFHGLALVSIALTIRVLIRGGTGRTIVLCLLNAFLAGGNYATALMLTLTIFSIIGLCLFMKRPGWKRLILPAAVLVLGFVISLCAPGNAVHTSAAKDTPGVLRTVAEAFRLGARLSRRWISLPLIGCLLFLLGLVASEPRDPGFVLRLPGMVTLWSFCLLCSMFTPTLYTIGSIGPNRLLNIIYDTYILLLIGNAYYWGVWLRQKKIMRCNAKQKTWILPMMMLFCALCWGAHIINGGAYTATAAIGTLRSGEAARYYQDQVERLKILEDSSVQNAVLEPLRETPFLLYRSDIVEDPDAHYINESMAEFYGKEKVLLRQGD